MAEEQEVITKTTGAMECTECGTIFYTLNFGRNNSADSCSCRNMIITLGDFYAPKPGRAESYIKLQVRNRETVKIYSVYRDTLERVQPHKDY